MGQLETANVEASTLGDVEKSPVDHHVDTDAFSDEAKLKEEAANKVVLDRYIRFSSIFNFEFILQSSWEGIAIGFQFAMLNGGPASLVYGAIFAAIGSTMVAMSLAEMASIDPTVGAQYRWSARWAPVAPRFFGLVQGWLTVFAWIFTASAVQAGLANMTTALIIFHNEDYVLKRWHTTLIIFLWILLPLLPNIWFRKFLNVFENTAGACCILFFLINIITLSVLGKRSENSFVWKTLFHESGWKNPGIAWCVGLITPVSALIGTDGVLHMSDEVKDVRTRVPYSMVSAILSNSILQFAFIICVLYSIGDISVVLSDTTGLAIIQVYYQATGSKAWTTIFVLMLIIMIYFCATNILASVSRLTYAFARDRGLPFSDFFSTIHPKLKIPVNALILICAVNVILALINIGSAVAYNAIVSLSTTGIFLSYVLPIGFFLLKKLNGSKIEYGPWSLGRWGIPVNVFAFAFTLFEVFWTPWPVFAAVTATTLNWAAPVLGAIILLVVVDWFVSGHKRFDIPVAQHVPTFREEEPLKE